jgi:hypothetical protein
MDIRSSTQAGNGALFYPTLTRGRAAEPTAETAISHLNFGVSNALNTLRARLAESGITLADAADANEFSPEKVAGRILDFIGLAVARAVPGEQEAVLAKARKGVEQGFREAREILESLPVLNGDIANNVDDTYARVLAGLDAMAGTAPVAATTSQSLVTASSRGITQSGEVQIETAEGDLVTVSFSSVSAQSRISVAAETEDGSVVGVARASYYSSQLSYSVEGDLNEDEQAAIDELLKRVDKISDRFFAGNVQAAFQQASHLNIDGEQIASFSLSLEQRSVQAAVSQYQSTQSNSSVPTGTQVLADYANEVRDLVNNPGAEVLADPGDAAAQLLDASITTRAAEDFGDSLQQGALSLLRDLLAYLLPGTQAAVTDTAEPESATAADTAPDVAAVAVDTVTGEPPSTAESALQVA